MIMKGKSNYIEGAKKLLASVRGNFKDEIIILSTESMAEICQYVFKAAKELGISDNLIYILFPDTLRPFKNVPNTLKKAITSATALIHIMDRMIEEDYVFNRPLRPICAENRCKYLFAYDCKLSYLSDGINADYDVVERKTKKIYEILSKSKEVIVTSDLGTSLSFKLYKDAMLFRTPYFRILTFNQAPEGELTACPIETSFNGRLVVDGTLTTLGKIKQPMVWDFKEGQVTNVKGNKQELDDLLKVLKSQGGDEKLNSLTGMYIAEFALGTNDWAVYDENLSNNEKVSGTIHFGMGMAVAGGINRGEKYHFDSIVTKSTVVVKDSENKEIKLIEEGTLLV